METEHLDASSPHRILIFSTGSLGDTLLVVPALRALRQHYPRAELVLLSDIQAGSQYVLAQDVLMDTGLIDGTLTYVVHRGRLAPLANLAQRLALAVRLRRGGFDALAYCVEAYRGDRRVARDRLFFRLAGMRRYIGMEGLAARPTATGLAIETVTNRADELLHRFGAAGISVPPAGEGVLDLNLGRADHAAFERWREALPPDGGLPWIGVGPGSKMPAKVWPAERFADLGRQLLDRFDVWPVVFGGPEDAALGDRLVQSWGRGYVAAGALGIRDAAVALGRCRLYVGNDTGTMHLAAAAGTPCVAIFSAREPAGRWHPYGPGHRVLRVAIECAGCCLTTCAERHNACLTRIPVDVVYNACAEVLTQQRSTSEAPG